MNIWWPAYSNCSFIIEKLKLQKICSLEKPQLSDLPTHRRSFVNIIIVSDDFEEMHKELKNFTDSEWKVNLVTSNTNLVRKAIEMNLKGLEIYLLYNSNDCLSFKLFNNCHLFTNDSIEYLSNDNIQYYWPDLSYSDHAFRNLRSNSIKRIVLMPFSVFNPDAETGVSFNPLGKKLLSANETTNAIELSIIIPHYENIENLNRTLNNLFVECLGLENKIEIILVDDGSQNVDKAELINCPAHFSVSIISLSRKNRRKMGDCSYRAAVARNTGATHAKGSNYLFLDCDILIDAAFLNSLLDNRHNYDLIMPKRKQLAPHVDKFYAHLNNQDILESSSKYWDEFYNTTTDWNNINSCWKYVSTYCLFVKSDQFWQLGGFNQNFVSYGCEDVEFGYRMHLKGAIFHLSDNKVFHQQPPINRSEFEFDQLIRQKLLKRSYYYLYQNTFSNEIYTELISSKQSSEEAYQLP